MQIKHISVILLVQLLFFEYHLTNPQNFFKYNHRLYLSESYYLLNHKIFWGLDQLHSIETTIKLRDKNMF